MESEARPPSTTRGGSDTPDAVDPELGRRFAAARRLPAAAHFNEQPEKPGAAAEKSTDEQASGKPPSQNPPKPSEAEGVRVPPGGSPSSSSALGRMSAPRNEIPADRVDKGGTQKSSNQSTRQKYSDEEQQAISMRVYEEYLQDNGDAEQIRAFVKHLQKRGESLPPWLRHCQAEEVAIQDSSQEVTVH